MSTSTEKLSRASFGAIITSSNKIYVFSSESNMLKVSAFTLDLTSTQISPTYYQSYGSATETFVGTSIAYTSAIDYAYVVGNINNLLSITKIKLSDGTSPFSYMVDNPTGTSTVIAHS